MGNVTIPMPMLNKGMALGLGINIGDVARTLKTHLFLSARITHPKGNRRYESWLYTVEKNELTGIHYANCEECLDRGYSVMYEECTKCGGGGCRTCKGSGEYPRKLPCQSCKIKPNTKRKN